MKRLFLLLACGATALAQPQPLPGPPTSSPNDQARFLTGLRLPPTSVLAPLQSSEDYLAHTREYSSQWRSFDARYFGPMRAFAQAHIAPEAANARALYYMFSGADFINAAAFFPDVPVYIMVGLEPVGGIAPPETLDAARIKAGLDNLRKSTEVTLQFSYFITKEMKVNLDQTDFRGVLPILESFIALSGGQITSVEPFTPGSGLVGVMINFYNPSVGHPQTVYYLPADLSNEGLRARPFLLKWMSGFQPAVAYLKAASYLLHEPSFTGIRDFLLARSAVIVQDDSGIPLESFQKSGPWDLKFFGAYTGTLELFKKYTQPALAEAYQKSVIGELPFGTGYKFKKGESNLLIASRPRPAPKAEPVIEPAPGSGVTAPPAF